MSGYEYLIDLSCARINVTSIMLSWKINPLYSGDSSYTFNNFVITVYDTTTNTDNETSPYLVTYVTDQNEYTYTLDQNLTYGNSYIFKIKLNYTSTGGSGGDITDDSPMYTINNLMADGPSGLPFTLDIPQNISAMISNQTATTSTLTVTWDLSNNLAQSANIYIGDGASPYVLIEENILITLSPSQSSTFSTNLSSYEGQTKNIAVSSKADSFETDYSESFTVLSIPMYVDPPDPTGDPIVLSFAATPGNNNVSLTWTPYTDGHPMKIYHSKFGLNDWIITSITTTDGNYSLNLSQSFGYNFYILDTVTDISSNAIDLEGWPGAPEIVDLSGQAGNNEIVLTWNTPDYSDVDTMYKITYDVSGGVQPISATINPTINGGIVEYTLTDLSNGFIYNIDLNYFFGSTASPVSNVVVTLPPSAASTIDLSFNGILTNNNISLSWAPYINGRLMRIYYKRFGLTNWSITSDIGTVDGNYSFSLSPNFAYTIYILDTVTDISSNAIDLSGWPTTEILDLSGEAGNNEIVLRWTTPPYSDSDTVYQIIYDVSGGVQPTIITVNPMINQQIAQYTLSNLSNGFIYNIDLNYFFGFTPSPTSTIVVTLPTPTIVLNFVGTPVDNSVTLSWVPYINGRPMKIYYSKFGLNLWTIINLDGSTNNFLLTLSKSFGYNFYILDTETDISSNTIDLEGWPINIAIQGLIGQAGNNEIDLTWTIPDYSDVDTVYNISYTVNGQVYTILSLNPIFNGQTAQYTLTGLTNGFTYDISLNYLFGSTVNPASTIQISLPSLEIDLSFNGILTNNNISLSWTPFNSQHAVRLNYTRYSPTESQLLSIDQADFINVTLNGSVASFELSLSPSFGYSFYLLDINTDISSNTVDLLGWPSVPQISDLSGVAIIGNNDKIILTWTPPQYSDIDTLYDITYTNIASGYSESLENVQATVENSIASYTLLSLTYGVTYNISISYSFGNNSSIQSSITVPINISPPTNLIVNFINETGILYIEWDKPISPDINNYKISYAVQGSSSFTDLQLSGLDTPTLNGNSGSKYYYYIYLTTFIELSFINNTNYQIALQAEDIYLNKSIRSIGSFTYIKPPLTLTMYPLTINNTATFTWAPYISGNTMKVFYRISGEIQFTEIELLQPQDGIRDFNMIMIDSGVVTFSLELSQSYDYNIYLLDDNIDISSNIINLSGWPADIAIVDLSGQAGNNQIVLTWITPQYSDNETMYKITYDNGQQSNSVTINPTINQQTAEYILTDLSNGFTYNIDLNYFFGSTASPITTISVILPASPASEIVLSFDGIPNNNNVNLSWVPYINGHQMDIYYSRFGLTEWTIISTETSSYSLSLTQSFGYSFYVVDTVTDISSNTIDLSGWPTTAIQDLSGQGNNNQIVLTWITPPNSDADTMYKITYDNGQQSNSVTVNPTATPETTEYTLTDLSNGFTYNINLNYFFGFTPSPISNISVTLPASPSSEFDLSFNGILTNNNISLSWTPYIEEHTVNLNYIKYSPTGSQSFSIDQSQFGQITVNGSVASFELSLSPSFGYSFYLLDINTDISSNTVDLLGWPSVPQISDLSGEAVIGNTNQIVLRWTIPQYSDSDTLYDISYTNLASGFLKQLNDVTVTLDLVNSLASYTLTDLSNGTTYDINISYSFGNNSSIPRNVIVPIIIPQPTNFSVNFINDSLNLLWDNPYLNNITRYKISYAIEGSSSFTQLFNLDALDITQQGSQYNFNIYSTTFNEVPFINNTNYQIALQAVNAYNNESIKSIITFNYIASPITLSIVGDLTNKTATFTWTPYISGNTMKVFYRISGEIPFTEIVLLQPGSVNPNVGFNIITIDSNNMANFSLQLSQSYIYNIYLLDDNRDVSSNIINVTNWITPPITNLIGIPNVNNETITLTWDRPPNSDANTRHTLYYTNSQISPTVDLPLNLDNTYTLSNLDINLTYTISLSYFFGGVQSIPNTIEVSLITISFSAQSFLNGNIILDWSNPNNPNITSYKILFDGILISTISPPSQNTILTSTISIPTNLGIHIENNGQYTITLETVYANNSTEVLVTTFLDHASATLPIINFSNGSFDISNNLTLTWSNPNISEIRLYNVFYKKSYDSNYNELISIATNASSLNLNLENNTYSYTIPSSLIKAVPFINNTTYNFTLKCLTNGEVYVSPLSSLPINVTYNPAIILSFVGAPDNNSVTLSWIPYINERLMDVYYSRFGLNNWTIISDIPTENGTYSLNLSQSFGYSFYVLDTVTDISSNTIDLSGWPANIAIVDLSGEAGNNEIVLRWTAPPYSDEDTMYKITYNNGQQSNSVTFNPTINQQTAEYILGNLANGFTYTIDLNYFFGSTDSPITTKVVILPAAPASAIDLSFNGILTNNNISLSWDPYINGRLMDVYYSRFGLNNWTIISDIATVDGNYSFSLSPSFGYNFYILDTVTDISSNAIDLSGWPTTQILDLSGEAGNNEIVLRWTAPPYSDEDTIYEINYYDGQLSRSVIVNPTINQQIAEYTLTDLSNGFIYTIDLKYFFGSTDSLISIVVVTLPPSPSSAIVLSFVGTPGNDIVTLSWTPYINGRIMKVYYSRFGLNNWTIIPNITTINGTYSLNLSESFGYSFYVLDTVTDISSNTLDLSGWPTTEILDLSGEAGNNEIVLRWTAPPYSDVDTIYKITYDVSGGVQPTTVTVNSIINQQIAEYTLTDLSNGFIYNIDLNYFFGSTASPISTVAVTLPVPSSEIVLSFDGTPVDNIVTLSWTPYIDTRSMKVYYSKFGLNEWIIIDITTENGYYSLPLSPSFGYNFYILDTVTDISSNAIDLSGWPTTEILDLSGQAGNNEIILRWTAPPFSDEDTMYEINYYDGQQTSSVNVYPTINQQISEYTLTDVSNGFIYNIDLKYFFGSTASSISIVIVTLPADINLQPPSNFVADVNLNTGHLNCSWEESTDPNVAFYNLLIAEQGSSNYISSRLLSLAELQPGLISNYYYLDELNFQSIYTAGISYDIALQSTDSSGLQGILSPLSIFTIINPYPLLEVTFLISDGSSMYFAYTAPIEPTNVSYNVSSSDSENGPFNELSYTTVTDENNQTLFQIYLSSLISNTTVYFRFNYTSNNITSLYNVISEIVPEPTINLPSAPTDFIASDISYNSISLSWNPPTNIGFPAFTQYVLIIDSLPNIILNSSINSYNVNNLAGGETYNFQLYAENTDGSGTFATLQESTTPYSPSAPLLPGQSSYKILINGQIETFIPITTLNSSLDEIIVINNSTYFNNPTLVVYINRDLSGDSGVINSTIKAETSGIKNIIITNSETGTASTEIGQIQLLDGLTNIDISNSIIQLQALTSDLDMSNKVALVTATSPLSNELSNGIYGKFYFKLIDPTGNGSFVTSGFTLPFYFESTQMKTTTEVLSILRYNTSTNQYESVTNAVKEVFPIFSFNLTTNSSYSLVQQVPDPPTSIQVYLSNTRVYVSFLAPSFNGAAPITSYKVTYSYGSTIKTKIGSLSPIMIPSLIIGTTYSFYVTAINSFGESSPSTPTRNYTPIGTGTITGDPHITTIYGENYFLPNVNGRFLLFNNKNPQYNLYITSDCYFLTKEEIAKAPFVTKYLTNYTFMKTVNIKFRNQSIDINMNTLEVIYKNSNDIIINSIVSDKMILSKFYSENKRKELGNALNFNGKSRKIELIYKDIIYTITVAVDLGCADHRNDINIEGPNMESGYGAIISPNHIVKICNL